MTEQIQLVIVDDHPLYREGVASTLNAESDMRVIGEGGNAVEALQLSTSLLPDVVLLDINMPGNGILAAKTVAEACPVTKIIMLTFSEEENDVLSALKAGARGYILKGVSGRELKSVIRSVSITVRCTSHQPWRRVYCRKWLEVQTALSQPVCSTN
jgi:two-component system, NarL family, nitrate/nitrite response regulator NarL